MMIITRVMQRNIVAGLGAQPYNGKQKNRIIDAKFKDMESTRSHFSSQ